MADQNTPTTGKFKEAVCIDVGRVYDSCCDRDCLEDLRCFFTPRCQEMIEQALSIRVRSAEVLNTFIDVEPVSFNRGFYACDLTFFFLVKFDVFTAPHTQPVEVSGVAYFEKKAILYGSEGNIKVFSSEFSSGDDDEQLPPGNNAPKCVVDCVDPVALSAKLVDVCSCGCEHPRCMPASICRRLGGEILTRTDAGNKTVLVTLGLFSIVKLIRNVQVLVPIYDFCIPEKESDGTTDSPCDMFRKIEFPRPGKPRIHMIWTDSPCQVTCWNDGNMMIRAFRSSDIECIVSQHPWLENDCYFADLILPVATKYEMADLGNDPSSVIYNSIFPEDKCVEPIGESLSDFRVCAKVAEKLGGDYFERYTGNYTDEELIRMFYETTDASAIMDWDEFSEKQMCLLPLKKDVGDVPAGLYRFYSDQENHPLTTPTGKLEYSSTEIEEHMPDDRERPPVPQWIEKGPSHDERLSGERAEKYPLLCVSNHGRWRMHAQLDDVTWNREIETMKIRGKDGYQYEPVWLHPSEALKRGIEHGDIVKVFNERGIVLCGAYVTERIVTKTCYIDHGARLDPIIPGELDRGGAINTITPASLTSKNSTGMAVSGFLVEAEKVTDSEMEEWKRLHPEAFSRRLDPAAGVCLDGWLLEPEG